MAAMSKTDLKELIRRDWAKAPSSSGCINICFAILDYVTSNPKISHITFGKLRKEAGIHYSEKNLLLAIQYLCGSRVPLLESAFELIEDDENEFLITKKQLKEAEKSGFLVHPDTGDEIRDYDDKVFMFFVPTQLARSLKN